MEGNSLLGTNKVMALGDVNGDGYLDLAVGGKSGALLVLPNDTKGSLVTAKAITVVGQVTGLQSLAWGDFNGDYHQDLVVGYGADQPNQLFLNNGDGTLREVSWGDQSDPTSLFQQCRLRNTRALAWGDVNGDGRLDLAVGNDGAPNCLYLNGGGGKFSSADEIAGSGTEATTSLDWGDWNNDGLLDLAEGNAGQPNRVYVNLGNGQLAWLWESSENPPLNTTGVRWGDADNDGDLDLAVSQGTDAVDSGYYVNNYAAPLHMSSAAGDILVPNPSAYAYVPRPGNTKAAYLFSSSEVLGSIFAPTVNVGFRLYFPNGDGVEERKVKVLPEFSTNGGGVWKPATLAAGASDVLTVTLSPAGKDYAFSWNAQADKAVADNAQFRVTVLNDNNDGLVQTAAASAISPPFQVRATTCIWPARPSILINDKVTDTVPIATGESQVEVDFTGLVGEGSGTLVFSWDFGDGSQVAAQRVKHTFGDGTYTVTLKVAGPACPVARTTALSLPHPGRYRSDAEIPLSAADLQRRQRHGHGRGRGAGGAAGGAAPVERLAGAETSSGVELTWDAAEEGDAPAGYRVYRAAVGSASPPALIKTLPATATAFADAGSHCGQGYFVTAFNAAGESAGSPESFVTAPCQ